MPKAASFMCMIMCAMILFMSALALQDNSTDIKEGLLVLNNTAMNNTAANNASTNFAAIDNTAVIKTSVNEDIRDGNNTIIKSATSNENKAPTKENSTSSVGQNNTTSKQMNKMQSSSLYDIDMNTKVKPIYNLGAYSHFKGLFYVGNKSESGAFDIGMTAKLGLDFGKNASLLQTFGLGSPAKSIVDAAKQPFLCNIV